MPSAKKILNELVQVHEAQKALAKRATELINQLGEVSTSSSSRKGLVELEISSRVLARRRESAFKK